MSFRSRSGRGSVKSGSNVNIQKAQDAKPEIRRQRTLLSQTSWRSMPLIPNLMRSLSKQSSSTASPRHSPCESPSPTDEASCGLCGFWKPPRQPDIGRQQQNGRRQRDTSQDIKEEEDLRDAVIAEESEAEDAV